MKLVDRAIGLLPWAMAALLIAGVVHIVSVLLMPLVAPRHAYARLVEAAKSDRPANAETARNGVMLFDPPAPGPQLLPVEDPAMAEGVCLFDLAKGPLRLRVDIDSEDYFGLSFHDPSGAIFHSMTDRASNKGKIDIIVGDARQIEEMETSDYDEAPPLETRLTAPSPLGFVLIRALAKRPSDYERARASVEAVSCEIEAER
ncbi:MAG: DUF1254 domain-containing protein [Methylocystis sp.]